MYPHIFITLILPVSLVLLDWTCDYLRATAAAPFYRANGMQVMLHFARSHWPGPERWFILACRGRGPVC